MQRFTEKLKFDRRLAKRPGWAASEEWEQNLSQLPDVSDRVQREDERPPAAPDPDAGSPPASDPEPGAA